MTDVYTQENASKKKFLAPVLVILLCMVSLTAAGYAYSSTVVNTDDSVDINGVTLALRNAGDSADVTAAMYTVNDIDIATHTVNGKAIKYTDAAATNAKGFKNDGTQLDATANYANLAAFGNGYYVEVLKNDVSAGYHDAPVKAELDTAAEISDAVDDKIIFKIGNDYKLKVNNQSGGQVKIQADLDVGTLLADKAISDIFLVLKDGDAVAGIIAASDDGFVDITGAINDEVAKTYTVEAYIALTDYYSESVPTDFVAKSFAVLFQTVEYVAP